MNVFFAITRLNLTRDYSVSLVTRNDILEKVESQFNASTRILCQDEPTHEAMAGEAARYLRQKWAMVEFYPYTVEGASAFLEEAKRLGKRVEVQAITHVQGMRAVLDRYINAAINGVRAGLIQELRENSVNLTDDEYVKEVARIAEADVTKLLNLV